MNGGEILRRQWRHKFVTTSGQAKEERELIIHNLVEEMDLGKELDKTIVKLEGDSGAMLGRFLVSVDRQIRN